MQSCYRIDLEYLFQSIPDELLFHVAGFLDIKSIARLAMTCRRFHDSLNDIPVTFQFGVGTVKIPVNSTFISLRQKLNQGVKTQQRIDSLQNSILSHLMVKHDDRGVAINNNCNSFFQSVNSRCCNSDPVGYKLLYPIAAFFIFLSVAAIILNANPVFYITLFGAGCITGGLLPIAFSVAASCEDKIVDDLEKQALLITPTNIRPR